MKKRKKKKKKKEKEKAEEEEEEEKTGAMQHDFCGEYPQPLHSYLIAKSMIGRPPFERPHCP